MSLSPDFTQPLNKPLAHWQCPLSARGGAELRGSKELGWGRRRPCGVLAEERSQGTPRQGCLSWPGVVKGRKVEGRKAESPAQAEAWRSIRGIWREHRGVEG